MHEGNADQPRERGVPGAIGGVPSLPIEVGVVRAYARRTMSDPFSTKAVPGESTLAEALVAAGSRRPDEAWLTALLRDLAAELEGLHRRGKLHRGLSPNSVRQAAGRWRLLEAAAPEPGFAAPEADGPGPWSDLYALAALVRWALAGRVPQAATARLEHDQEPPLAQLPGVRCSERFAFAIDHAFRLDPEQRTRDVPAFCDELGIPRPSRPGQKAMPPRQPAAMPVLDDAPPLAAPMAASMDAPTATPPQPAAAAAPEPQAAPALPPPEPLRFGLSAPRHAAPDSDFALVFMAYVDSARAATLAQVQAMAGETHRQLMDLAADDPGALWRPGTPFTVKVTGRAFEVEPAELAFKWNGIRQILNFALHVRPGASGAALVSVLVSVEGVAVASFSLPVEIGSSAAAAAKAPPAPPPAEVSAPRSVFASYSSRDAAEVAARLSTLTRWAPALDIFQDCLDLKPNEAFKPQLAGQIAGRDAFLLFWSRHAAASSWVRWELDTALASKPAQAILPMPLEDPALAPPPAGLADLHFRDRFLMAGYAAQAIAAARDATPPAGGR